MSTSIKYQNLYGEEISLQQINNIDSFMKIFLTNNVPQNIDCYENGTLLSTSYVVTSQQEIDSILQKYPTVSFKYSYTVGNYHLEEYLSYNNNILSYRSINVIYNENIICNKLYKLNDTNNLVHYYTDKYYYLSNGTHKYTFDYGPDGNCYIIHDEEFYQSDIYAWNIGVDPDVTFTWTGFEYYQNIDPLVPEN